MRAQKSASSLMDGGAYAPIVSRILKSGRWVGSDGGEGSAGVVGLEVGICGEKFPAGNLEGCRRPEGEIVSDPDYSTVVHTY